MKNRTIAAAKKAAKKAVKKVAAKKAPAKKAAVKKTASKTVKKVAAKAVKKTAKKAAAKTPSLPKTTINASVDVGFGNSLYLRGDAPGLSWAQGVPMECDSDSKWSISIAGVVEPFEFKVLINDDYWSAGYNQTAKPGAITEVQPEF